MPSQPQVTENPVEDARTVAHDQVDDEAQRTDRGDPEARDKHDLGILVRRGPARLLQDTAIAALPGALRPLLDPPLKLPAPVHDVRHGLTARCRPRRGGARAPPGPGSASISRRSG